MPRKKDCMITSVYMTKEMCKQLDKAAQIEGFSSRGELIRSYIEKGLNTGMNRENEEFITNIIRQELKAVFHEREIKDVLKTVVEAQTNRLAKMLMKIGKLSSAEFFLMMKLLIYMWDEKADHDFDTMLRNSVNLGVDYMQKKDFQINSFLEDATNLRNLAENLD